ncbi:MULTISPECIES: sigma 54-interacting transcriptional regulator [unclassified Pseudodesulfovibrio]|uniref:sigma-54 interaction domain-containing protein n=1 Tax=unclassified Pseudodesulfovibrio TaxID=2661612 RepID=UPI000FEC05C3|nr:MULTISPECIES: sigma 54-interacting transcriptional regulator [unclassified Pseudodesulfovibrio]MCJ2165487.1 sigma 54-interacting transcriptional regulator [Pseudodesulfovibrio sp. S3-i]RWU03236.1 PAS domain S-box protein [Pseudodesulfovibrio sp. S3]
MFHDGPSSEQYQAILESISDGVFTVDTDWRITSFNNAAERITGIPRKEALGRRCSDVFRSSMCNDLCCLRETQRTGMAQIGRTGYIIDAAGNRIPISLSTAVLRDANGKVIGGAETFRDLSEVEALRNELEGRFRVGDLVSRSPRMQRVFSSLDPVAASSSTVLILGETGTGKELIARTIHDLSPRKDGPFVAINCGALPETLLESELFGYKAGAFTGATKDKPGRFAQAAGGVLFLDEIGNISPAMQVRLLRVLQEQAYDPLGSVAPEKADVRIIAATNSDVAEMVRQGTFREDFYYRINVARVELPPLRLRKEDIPLLCMDFIQYFNALQGKQVDGLASETLSLLMIHSWPGNVRELRNIIERAFIVCHEGLIEPGHLPPDFFRMTGTVAAQTYGGLAGAIKKLEIQLIRDAVSRNQGNRLAAARELGIHKSTLFRKISQLGIDLPTRNDKTGLDGPDQR